MAISEQTRTLLINFNRFLSEVYGYDLRFSDLLKHHKFSEENIQKIREICLQEYLDDLIYHLNHSLVIPDTDWPLLQQSILHYYELIQNDTDKSEIQNLYKKALERIQTDLGIRRLEAAIVDLANKRLRIINTVGVPSQKSEPVYAGQIWSESDLLKLQKLFNKGDEIEVMASRLGRSNNAVFQKIRNLALFPEGLETPDDFDILERHGKAWEYQEDQQLIYLYKKLGKNYKVIGVELDRSPVAVYLRLRKLINGQLSRRRYLGIYNGERVIIQHGIDGPVIRHGKIFEDVPHYLHPEEVTLTQAKDILTVAARLKKLRLF